MYENYRTEWEMVVNGDVLDTAGPKHDKVHDVRGADYPGFGWDRVTFLHSSGMFWIYDQNHVDNTPMF